MRHLEGKKQQKLTCYVNRYVIFTIANVKADTSSRTVEDNKALLEEKNRERA